MALTIANTEIRHGFLDVRKTWLFYASYFFIRQTYLNFSPALRPQNTIFKKFSESKLVYNTANMNAVV